MKFAPGLFAGGIFTLLFFSIIGGIALIIAGGVMAAIERKVPDVE